MTQGRIGALVKATHTHTRYKVQAIWKKVQHLKHNAPGVLNCVPHRARALSLDGIKASRVFHNSVVY
jgi:hypothetical protein